MSEFDVNAGHEGFDLDHGHQDFGDQDNHLQNFDAFGNNHQSELDEHFAQGNHVESDTPGSHFEEDNFTNADVHASESDTSFGEHSNEADNHAAFGDLDRLHEDGNLDTLSEHSFDGGGAGEISAVSN